MWLHLLILTFVEYVEHVIVDMFNVYCFEKNLIKLVQYVLLVRKHFDIINLRSK